MRQIKFRGRSVHSDSWIYGSLYENGDIPEIHGTVWDKALKRDLWVEEEVYFDTIGQFTCLLDKNGKEIYEGDIVRRTKADYVHQDDEDAYTIQDYGVIKYDERIAAFVFVLNEPHTKPRTDILHHTFEEEDGCGVCVLTCTYEVLGNIHDDHELLNKVMRNFK